MPPLRVHVQGLQAVALLSLAVLALLVYFNFDHLSVRSTMADNADVLFSEDIARDLNAGGRLFDWRLSQVPYLFPDILLARMIAYAGAGVGNVAAWYSVIFGCVLLGLVFVLARLCEADARAVSIAVALLYLLSYFGVELGDHIAVHFGLIGEHCGALVPIILATIFFWLSVRGRMHALALVALLASLTLGIISDSLVAVMLLPALAAYLFFLRRAVEWRRQVAVGLTMALAVLLGRIFSYANPFPTDREFLQAVLSRFPESSFASVKSFAGDLVFYATHNYLSALILALTILSWSCCLRYIACAWKARTDDLSFLLSLIVVYAVPAVIAAQLLLGLYDGMGTARQWAPVTLLALICGAIVATAKWRRVSGYLFGLTLAFCAVVTLHLAVVVSRHGSGGTPRLFGPLVACMENNNLPGGWLYASDYWIARPVRLFSKRYGVVPISGGVSYTNQANVFAIRAARPEYFITGYAASPADVVREFGPPRMVLCGMTLANGQAVSVMDYSDSDAFKAKLQNAAASAY